MSEGLEACEERDPLCLVNSGVTRHCPGGGEDRDLELGTIEHGKTGAGARTLWGL